MRFFQKGEQSAQTIAIALAFRIQCGHILFLFLVAPEVGLYEGCPIIAYLFVCMYALKSSGAHVFRQVRPGKHGMGHLAAKPWGNVFTLSLRCNCPNKQKPQRREFRLAVRELTFNVQVRIPTADVPEQNFQRIGEPETHTETGGIGGETQHIKTCASVQFPVRFVERKPLAQSLQNTLEPFNLLPVLLGFGRRSRVKEISKQDFCRAGLVCPEYHAGIPYANHLSVFTLKQIVQSRGVGASGIFRDRGVGVLFLAVGGKGGTVERDKSRTGALCADNTLDGGMSQGNTTLPS